MEASESAPMLLPTFKIQIRPPSPMNLEAAGEITGFLVEEAVLLDSTAWWDTPVAPYAAAIRPGKQMGMTGAKATREKTETVETPSLPSTEPLQPKVAGKALNPLLVLMELPAVVVAVVEPVAAWISVSIVPLEPLL